MERGSIRLNKSGVVFNERDHTYHLEGKQLFGITGTLIRRAFPDKYSGVDEETLRNAAQKGSEVHKMIESHDRFDTAPDNIRLMNYEQVKYERGLTVIENEYLVSDNERYASSIDIVMVNRLGEICLVDTKTTYNLDRQSTALQLSIYRWLFELQNPDLKVRHIFVLWLPNKDESIAEIHELSFVPDDVIEALIDADINDEPFTYSPIPDEYAELEAQYRYWDDIREQAENNLKGIKEKVISLMKDKNLSQIKSGFYTVSYIPGKKGRRFDSQAFKRENKPLYESYMRETETAEQVRFLKTNKDEQIN